MEEVKTLRQVLEGVGGIITDTDEGRTAQGRFFLKVEDKRNVQTVLNVLADHYPSEADVEITTGELKSHRWFVVLGLKDRNGDPDKPFKGGSR